MERLNNGRQIINYKNLNYVKYKKNVEGKFEISFDHKTKLKLVNIKTPRVFNDMTSMINYFQKHNMHPIAGHSMFINTDQILYVDEICFDENTKQFEILIYFGNQITTLHVMRDSWNNFKNTRL